jgi:CRP/FNR family transcriptional regulator, cyclic AMP receptor protein
VAREALLTAVSVFRELEPGLLRQIATLVRPRQCPPREIVVQQGDPGDGLYNINTGYLKVTLAGPTGTSSTLSIMGPGEMFGELSLLDGGARSATVTAITRCELGAIAFLRLFESRPNLGIALMEVVARRLRRLSERSDDLATLPVPSRLAKQLLQLAGAHAVRVSPRRLRLAVPLSQRELGELVGATRESVNKYLRQWKKIGALEEESGYLVITDLERLQQLSQHPEASP